MLKLICACSEPEGDQCIRKAGTVPETDWLNIIVIFLFYNLFKFKINVGIVNLNL